MIVQGKEVDKHGRTAVAGVAGPLVVVESRESV
jgi:hypothetical protein